MAKWYQRHGTKIKQVSSYNFHSTMVVWIDTHLPYAIGRNDGPLAKVVFNFHSYIEPLYSPSSSFWQPPTNQISKGTGHALRMGAASPPFTLVVTLVPFNAPYFALSLLLLDISMTCMTGVMSGIFLSFISLHLLRFLIPSSAYVITRLLEVFT